MSSYTVTAAIDITKDVCPMTWYKVKMKLSSMKQGDLLEIVLKDGPPLKTVTTSLKQEGDKVIDVKKGDGIFTLIVEKG